MLYISNSNYGIKNTERPKILKKGPRGLSLNCIIIFFCLFAFILFWGDKNACPGDYDYVIPFEARLTIKSDSCNQGTRRNDITELFFGFDKEARVWSCPPPSPDSCFEAFIDSDNTYTIQDGNNNIFDQFQGLEDKFAKTLFSVDNQLINESWVAVWGIRVYRNPLFSSQTPLSLELIWDPNELLIPGPFDLQYKNQITDMHLTAKISMDDIQDGSLISIRYRPGEKLSALGIVFTGGGRNEYNYRGSYSCFNFLTGYAYSTIKNIIKAFTPSFPETPYSVGDDIRYIYYRPYHDLDGWGNDVFSVESLSQKDNLRESINWAGERWIIRRPQEAFLIIYIVDHGNSFGVLEKGEISIDPYNLDRNKQKLRGSELNSWLTAMEVNLRKNSIYNYEILIFTESCYSKAFIDNIRDRDFPNRIFLASADADSTAQVGEYKSFTYYFLKELMKRKNLWDTFKYINCGCETSFRSQRPYLCDLNGCYSFSYYDPNCNLMPRPAPTKFDTKLNNLAAETLPCIPEITGITAKKVPIAPDVQNIFKIDFTIYSDTNIKEAWASIETINCYDEWCRFSSDPNDSYCDGNKCTFSPDYYFFLPEKIITIFVRDARGGQVSPPYFFYDPDILDIPPISPDVYETDDDPEQITISTKEFQFHSFHNPDDTDWIYFFAEAGYQIKLLLPSPLPVDPNKVPFEIAVYILGEERQDLKPYKIAIHDYDDYRYEDINITKALIYYYNLDIGSPNQFIYLKITSSNAYTEPFPYIVHLHPDTAQMQYYIFGEVSAYYKKYLKDEGPVLFDCTSNKIEAHWIPSPQIEYDLEYHSEYFYFVYTQETLSQPDCCFSLFIDGNKRGEICPDSNTKNVLDAGLLRGYELPKAYPDSDNDTRSDSEEIKKGTDPNTAEIIIHPGLNLFRYPLWAEYWSGSGVKCGIDLKGILYDPNRIDPRIIESIKRIVIFTDQDISCNTDPDYLDWHDYDSTSEEIFLKNKTGAFIYFDQNLLGYSDPGTNSFVPYDPDFIDNNKSAYIDLTTHELIIKLPEHNNPGVKFSERLNESEIKLSSGLNIKALIGFKSFYDKIKSLTGNVLDPSSLNNSLKGLSIPPIEPVFKSIMRYDHEKGEWQTKYPFFSETSGDTFTLTVNEAYIIYMGGEKGKEKSWLPKIQ